MPGTDSTCRASTRPLNLLFVISRLERGGMERQLSILAPALVGLGHSVTVSVNYRGGYYEDVLLQGGVRLHYRRKETQFEAARPHKRFIYAAGSFAELLRLARGDEFDVIYAFGSSSNLYASAVKLFTGSKVVWGIRDSKENQAPVISILERLFRWNVDVVVPNSQAGRRTCLRRGYKSDCIVVVENGIETERFRIDESVRAETRELLNISSEQILIGTVGRLDPVKGHEIFIEAAKLISQSCPNAVFVVVGGGADKERFDSLLEMTIRVGLVDKLLWVGVKPNVEDYLNAMDIFVLSSSSEGFPNVIAEAMSCGVPCVVTDVGDSASMVGELGMTVPPDNPNALADAVVAMCANRFCYPRESLRMHVIDNWSVQRMVINTQSLLLELID